MTPNVQGVVEQTRQEGGGLEVQARSVTWGQRLRRGDMWDRSVAGRQRVVPTLLPTWCCSALQGTGVSGCSHPCSSLAPVAVGFGG